MNADERAQTRDEMRFMSEVGYEKLPVRIERLAALLDKFDEIDARLAQLCDEAKRRRSVQR